jgi:hypothetical protein
MGKVHALYPETTFKWVCFENDLETSNWNCRNDSKRPKEMREGNVLKNNNWTNYYEIPEGATILKVFRLAPLDEG